jgi:DNA-binding transcriptional regulator GbsR (MarR family)
MQLYEFLSKNPGSTIYNMSKALDWSVGKVQSALKRLEDDLVTKATVEGGRVKKHYSLKKVEDFLDFTKF